MRQYNSINTRQNLHQLLSRYICWYADGTHARQTQEIYITLLKYLLRRLRNDADDWDMLIR